MNLLIITETGAPVGAHSRIWWLPASTPDAALVETVSSRKPAGIVFAGVKSRDPIEPARALRSHPDCSGVPIVVMHTLQELLARSAISLCGQMARDWQGAQDRRTIVVDQPGRQTAVGQVRMSYSPLELRLLLFLMRYPDLIFCRDELWHRVSSSENVNCRIIDSLVLRIRKKLEIDPSQPTHLRTLRLLGYSFHYGETIFVDALTRQRFLAWPKL